MTAQLNILTGVVTLRRDRRGCPMIGTYHLTSSSLARLRRVGVPVHYYSGRY